MTQPAPRKESAASPSPRRVGEEALRLEAAGIEKLAASLDENFDAAVATLFTVRGRIIVTGMGKSGHIARKMAATFASTGAPAQYVHPGEASHGDLGMITTDDAVLALSNSGETTELSDILDYAARFDIPLIAITSKAQSPLADAARITLLLPSAQEACPLGLAPTTSTTMMVALGDALAVALLARRGFTREDYRALHPGGKLGRRLLKVQDLMQPTAALPLAMVGTPMSDAILTMSAKGFGCIGVTDAAGALRGIITDGDLRRHMGPHLLEKPVETLMTPDPKTIASHQLAAEALGRMNEARITVLFVVDAEKVVGLIRMHDCLAAGIA